MGFRRFIARRGTVGGTARVIAKQFNHYIDLYPSEEKCVIYQMIIRNRYYIIKNKDLEVALLEKAQYDMNGLKQLVIDILSMEAGLKENTID